MKQVIVIWVAAVIMGISAIAYADNVLDQEVSQFKATQSNEQLQQASSSSVQPADSIEINTSCLQQCHPQQLQPAINVERR